MSCNEWESGTLKIPAKDYSKLRKAVITEHNRLQDERLNKALRAHAQLLLAKKGKRGFDLYKHATTDYNGLGYDVTDLLFEYNHETRTYKFRKPKKKDLDKKLVSKGCTLSCGEASITFHDKTRCVSWDVPENNHACDTAHEKPLAKFLFRRFDNITWTRGSGGEIVGNNEYNREADYAGGGGNFVVATYPKPKRKW